VIQRDIITSIKKLSVAIAGICLKDSYVYVTQQDAPHKDKIDKISYSVYKEAGSETSNYLLILRSLLSTYNSSVLSSKV
jgi:hypothetical protein